jgi:RHS repeat-associated protein
MQRGTLSMGKTAISPETFAQCFSLDATGNWQSFREDDNGDGSWDLVQGRTSNLVNEITAISNSVGSAWQTPAYDAAGNMTTMPQPGNPGSGYTGTYDAWNRLISLSASGSQVAGYAYDGLKRRTVKQVYSGGVLSETRDFYYSQSWQVLEERVNGSTDAKRQFVWGQRYIDDILLRDRDTTGSGTLDERLYGLQDPNWNLTALSDTTRTVQERYGYSAYGDGTVLTPTFGVRAGTLFDWEVRYAAYRWDEESGLYPVRNRHYNPPLGCWGSRDPLGLRAGMNLGSYVRCRPINRVDPLGTICQIGVHCYAATYDIAGSIRIGKHCGLTVTDDTHTFWVDGQWQKLGLRIRHNRKPHPEFGPSDSEQTDFDDSVCECLKTYTATFNAAGIPYAAFCRNSNWALKCISKHCGLGITWSWWTKPIGWDNCWECVQYSPATAKGCTRCIRSIELTCP